jgi:hypothetical protein
MNMPKQKTKNGHPVPARILTKVVICAVINERKQFVTLLTPTANGQWFIPSWATDPAGAKDFLSQTAAENYAALFHPAAKDRVSSIELIDVPFDPVGVDTNIYSSSKSN